jgi:uncharacterized protein (TIGR02246 family)
VRVRLKILVVAALSASAAEGAGAQGALSTIVRADSEWLGAMRAHDADRIVAWYDSAGMFVTAAGVVIRGRDSIAALYRRRFKALARVTDGGIVREGTQTVNDTLVYEWGRGTLTFTDTAGTKHTSRGPYLTVWRREGDGAWRIIRNLVF